MPRSRTAQRALAVRRRREQLEQAPAQKPAATRKSARPAQAAQPAAWPTRITHDELDELAKKHGVELDPTLSKADKQTALDAAGVTPED